MNKNIWNTISHESEEKAQLDAQYREGQWDFLYSIEEIGHHMIIVGYLPYLHANPRILDVGCGQGRLFDLLHKTTYQSYMGIDLSEEAIQRAKQLKHSKAHFEVANYEHWQPPGKFDIIIFNETLYYSDQPREVLRKYSRYLTSGGAIILSIHRFLNNERIWEQIDSDYTLVASDTVINRRGQTWDVRALRPHLSNRFFARWLRIIYTLRKLFSRRSSAKTG